MKALGDARLVGAMVLYAALLVLSLATLGDWRIRLATMVVILLFAGRTLWQPRRNAAPAPWGREADVAPPESGGAGQV